MYAIRSYYVLGPEQVGDPLPHGVGGPRREPSPGEAGQRPPGSGQQPLGTIDVAFYRDDYGERA